MAKRTQIVERVADKVSEVVNKVRDKKSRQKGAGKQEPTAPSAMKKEYEVLTAKAIIDGKLHAIGDKIKLTIEEAANHRERGIGLRFPKSKDAA